MIPTDNKAGEDQVLLLSTADDSHTSGSGPAVVREKRFLLAAAILGGLVGYRRGYYGKTV